MKDYLAEPGFFTGLGIKLRNVTIRRYSGRGAERYETHRKGGRWASEFEALRQFYQQIDPRSVLDCPVGTGRWFDDYRSNGAEVFGVDISENMLAEAREAVRPGEPIRLARADVLDPAKPPALGQGYDLIVCTRFVYWLRPIELAIVLRRFHATGSRYLLASAKVAKEGGEPKQKQHSGGLLYRLDRLRAHIYRAIVKQVYDEASLLEIFHDTGWRLTEKKLIVATSNLRYFYYLFERSDTERS